MISLEEAQRHVLSSLVALAPETVLLHDALGRVAAEDVVATEPVPGFANSSMDGFALRASDTEAGAAALRIVGAVLAGGVPAAHVGAGEALRIMTGAPLPEGADAVEPIETAAVDPAGTTVSVAHRVEAGSFVRRPGDDVAVGQRLVAAGDVLHATRLGVLASQGVTEVLVHRRPRVAVLSTGDELARDAGPLKFGAIRDVNRPLLIALLGDAGVAAVDLGVVRDDYRELFDAISRGVEGCDAVISTGGVSVGDADFVKAVIAELAGASARSMQVAVRPGKPFAFGVVEPRAVPVFGLPGNPVSTRVSFEFLVRPALCALSGGAVPPRLTTDAVVDCAMPRTRDAKVHMVHVVVRLGPDGRPHVVEAMREGSHLLHAVARANAIAIVPDGEGLEPGETVRAVLLDPGRLEVVGDEVR